MNEHEIESFRVQPAGSHAQRAAHVILIAFMREVNAHSDGWAYWAAPVKAAEKLMELVQSQEAVTEYDLSRALIPIKSFYTRKGRQAGMEMVF